MDGESQSLARHQFYFTQSAYKVILQNSVPAQICKLTLYISNDQGYVDGFVRNRFLQNNFINTYCETKFILDAH